MEGSRRVPGSDGAVPAAEKLTLQDRLAQQALQLHAQRDNCSRATVQLQEEAQVAQETKGICQKDMQRLRLQHSEIRGLLGQVEGKCGRLEEEVRDTVISVQQTLKEDTRYGMFSTRACEQVGTQLQQVLSKVERDLKAIRVENQQLGRDKAHCIESLSQCTRLQDAERDRARQELQQNRAQCKTEEQRRLEERKQLLQEKESLNQQLQECRKQLVQSKDLRTQLDNCLRLKVRGWETCTGVCLAPPVPPPSSAGGACVHARAQVCPSTGHWSSPARHPPAQPGLSGTREGVSACRALLPPDPFPLQPVAPPQRNLNPFGSTGSLGNPGVFGNPATSFRSTGAVPNFGNMPNLGECPEGWGDATAPPPALALLRDTPSPPAPGSARAPGPAHRPATPALGSPALSTLCCIDGPHPPQTSPCTSHVPGPLGLDPQPSHWVQGAGPSAFPL